MGRQPLGQHLHSQLEGGAVAHQRRQIAKQDPRLGEIGDVTHAGAQERQRGSAGSRAWGSWAVSEWREVAHRVTRNLPASDLEVQVGPRGVPTLSDQGDAIAGPDRSPLGDQQAGVVRIRGQQIARVLEHDQVFVAADEAPA